MEFQNEEPTNDIETRSAGRKGNRFGTLIGDPEVIYLDEIWSIWADFVCATRDFLLSERQGRLRSKNTPLLENFIRTRHLLASYTSL